MKIYEYIGKDKQSGIWNILDYKTLKSETRVWRLCVLDRIFIVSSFKIAEFGIYIGIHKESRFRFRNSKYKADDWRVFNSYGVRCWKLSLNYLVEYK